MYRYQWLYTYYYICYIRTNSTLVYGNPIINVLCNNGNDGNVSITATGGTGNITYTLQPVGLVNTGFLIR
ncbi:MAG: SprB repeat-containing protein [Bacteroidetes bacterium]|nr:SprB repeat-containing protein [Bacteroidota bacterium]